MRDREQIRTTARMIAASSHQKECTIQTRVNIRSERKIMTSTRKAMVRPSIEGPQLPSPVGETEFVMVSVAFKMYLVGDDVEMNDYC